MPHLGELCLLLECGTILRESCYNLIPSLAFRFQLLDV